MYGPPQAYGPPQGPWGPPRGPVPPAPPRPASARPGPTGPLVALTSALVPVAYLAAMALVLLALNAIRNAPHLVTVVAFAVPVLIPLLYLAIVGRGLLGRLLGGGIMLVVVILDLAGGLLQLWVTHRSVGMDIVFGVLSMAVAVGVIIAWGAARRSGWLWLVSVPVGVAGWALWYFVLWDADVLDPHPGQIGRYVLRVAISMTVTGVIPILVGWAAEHLMQFLAPGPKTGPRGPAPAGPAAHRRY